MVNRNYFCAKSFKTYYDQENSAKMTEQLMDAAKTGDHHNTAYTDSYQEQAYNKPHMLY